MKKIEILAPAGNLDSLLAGIHSGADAVYFGYGELNARRNAKNFDEQSLAEASRLCKERGVKMHMTVNTMVYDREYDEVLRTLEASAPKNKVEQMDFDALQEYNSPAVPSEMMEKLETVDVETLTPIEALNFLYELKKTLKGSLNG